MGALASRSDLPASPSLRATRRTRPTVSRRLSARPWTRLVIMPPYSPGAGTGKVTWQPAAMAAPVAVQGHDPVGDHSRDLLGRVPARASGTRERDVVQTDVRRVARGCGDELQVHVVRAGDLRHVRGEGLPCGPAAGVGHREGAYRRVRRVVKHHLHQTADPASRTGGRPGVELAGAGAPTHTRAFEPGAVGEVGYLGATETRRVG